MTCSNCSCSRPSANGPGKGVVIAAGVLALAIVSALGFSRALSTQDAPPATPAPAAAPASEPKPKVDKPKPAASGERSAVPYGRPEPIPAPKGSLRVMTFNVENLFDDQDDPKLTGDADDKDMTKPREHREAIAAAIRAVNPDIIAMDEVESEQALRWFREQHLQGAGYDYLVSLDSGDGRGIECSILSKFPVGDAQVWPLLPLGGTHPAKWGNEENREAGKPILFRRSPLRATVTIPGDEVQRRAADAGVRFVKKPDDFKITLFAVHQKSGGPGGYWREREAAKTVELYGEFASKNPGQPVLILGDMNTQPGSKPIATYLSAGLKDLMDDRTSGDPKWITHATGRTIDFIFANDAAAKRVVHDTRFVLGMPQRPKGSDWKTTPAPPGYGSDHLPVVVDLTLTP